MTNSRLLQAAVFSFPAPLPKKQNPGIVYVQDKEVDEDDLCFL